MRSLSLVQVRAFSQSSACAFGGAEFFFVGCRIGEDYPKPIVEHEFVSKQNMGKLKAAYDAHKGLAADGGEDSDGEGPVDQGPKGKRPASAAGKPAKKAKTM